MRFARSWVLATLLAFSVPAVGTTSAPAKAAELTKEQARALFQEALALVAAGDFSNALAKLQQVASYKRTPQVVYYIGVCHEMTGKWVMALGEYRIALADAETAGTHDVVEEAKSAIAKLEPRIPLLTVTKGEGVGAARVTVDGNEIGDAAFGEPMPFDPGTRVVVGQAAGYKPFRREVKLGEGEKLEIEVELEKRVAGPPAVGRTDSVEEPTKHDVSHVNKRSLHAGSYTLAWVTTGIGVAGLGASAYFFSQRAKAISDLDDACGDDRKVCPASSRSTYDEGKRVTLLGNVALGVGVASAVAGAILFATSGSGGNESDTITQPEQPSSAVRFVPSSAGSWAGVSVDGRF